MTNPRPFDWIETLARDLVDRDLWKALARRLDHEVRLLMRHERAPRVAAAAGIALVALSGGVWLASGPFENDADAVAEIRGEPVVRSLAAHIQEARADIGVVEERAAGFMDLKSANALEKAASFAFSSQPIDSGSFPPVAMMQGIFPSPEEALVAEVSSAYGQTADASAHHRDQ